MIETLVKPVPLDNDVAVMKILQLMGQLSPRDMQHILNIGFSVYKVVREDEINDSSNA
jgi:hypothetical protein